MIQNRRLAATFTFLLFLPSLLHSAPPSTKPVEGLRDNTPSTYALTNARVVIAVGKTIDRATIVVRDHVVLGVGKDVRIPEEARIIDMAGRTIYPGIIDAFREATVDTAILKKGAPHWNPNVRPQLNMADQFAADKALNKELRRQGIVARLVAPSGGVIKGTSAVVSTGDEPNSHGVLNRAVAQHIRLTVSRGRDRKQFPNSPMGAVALARQAFYDADWHQKAWTAYRADSTLSRPEQNDALDALGGWLDGNGLMIADTSNELFVLRADGFAREFGLNLAIRGSGNEYRRIDAVRATGRSVIVPVNFPKPPNVATPESAMNVTLESLMHWDIAPENPGRLDRAGIRIALTSHGLPDAGKYLDAVRKAIDRGLDADSALRAMTETPATLFDVDEQLGTIETGKLASFVVADGDLFDKKTKVLETWVAGKRFEVKPQFKSDPRGNWSFGVKGQASGLVLKIDGQPGKLSGTIRRSKSKSKDETKLDKVGLHDARLSCVFNAEKFGLEGAAQLSAVLDESDEPTLIGYVVWPDGRQAEFVASRSAAKPEPDESKPDKDAKEEISKEASFAINYPMGAFGRTTKPEQSELVVKGATIWTCGPAGVVEDAMLLVRGGKIVAVGKDIAVPKGTRVVDVSGSHVTPGIIDCHSHMATDGGVNESTQAVTAEVRIGDFVDADDIAIYRQLAGGVTCANILHGSANPIGGQNQVIKFRWGALPEQLKFARAPQGIKFALGENVKQSNWGDDYTTRYPQTRMGVEQIMRDEFQAAREYQKRRADWKKNHRGLPPRRDLELDAISEILHGTRWIHCHSYRQDEILALIRVLDDFDVTIGSFQHILEGYKVADAMAKHGATGSAFSDWWAYKFEVYDAIPYNGALMHHAGVNVSFNSDDRELARHLNHEAAKAVKYGGIEPAEALKFVTLNPAIQLRIDTHVGSLEAGKDADFVVWSGSPLSVFSRCQQTWVDGRKYFDLGEDQELRTQVANMRTTLIQKILASGEAMRKPGEGDNDPASLWPRHDEFCHHHDHDDDHDEE